MYPADIQPEFRSSRDPNELRAHATLCEASRLGPLANVGALAERVDMHRAASRAWCVRTCSKGVNLFAEVSSEQKVRGEILIEYAAI